ncbi:MAG: hypothetical protein QOE70_2556 [Chthoniobacter sp.]|jgi:ABC-type transport system involved in multi-copper enzyme maturation permease subunit|nr:hypothetical protein [Chthoniobacter sp.]
MSSPLLALFVRSLRADARVKLTYAARAGLVAVVAVFMVLTVLASGWTGAPGLQFFRSIAFIQAVFITLAGCSYFASAITEEKEEQTLGLLRMTQLDPLSILLGKSTGRLCGALLLIAVQFPFTLLAVTLGGITAGQIVSAYLALGAYTFFLCNLALLASVLASRTGLAATLVGISLVGLGLLSNAAAGSSGPWQEVAEGFSSLLPFQRLAEVLATGFAGPLAPPGFWISLLAGLACFFLAWLVFDRCCASEGDAAPSAGPRWWRRRFPVSRAWPWPRAMAWKDFHFIHGGRGAVYLKLAAYVVLVILNVWSSTGFQVQSALSSVIGLAILIITAELGFAASRIFSVEKRERTWSGLALLPLTVEDLHRAKLASLHHAVLPAFLATLVVPALILICLGTYALSDLIGAVFLLLGIGYAGTLLHFFVHFTAWLSLLLPRGALPIGIAVLFVGTLLGMMIGMLLFGVGVLLLPVFAIIFAKVCRDKTLALLGELAAEE